jgi:hypothetical protein
LKARLSEYVAPDGRFIMIQNGRTEAPQTQIALVQNWFEEVKRRVSTSITQTPERVEPRSDQVRSHLSGMDD